MAIFSRRVLQRLLNENAKFLTRKQLRNHVDELNRMPETLSLAHEWEVVVLNAFNYLGQISHEKNLGGTSKPDIYFQHMPDCGESFAADITAVSDKGFEEGYPFDALFEELAQRVKKYALRPESFSLQVEGNHGKLYRGGPKAKLFIPGRARFPELLFNVEFEKFIGEIKAAPNLKRSHQIKNIQQEIDIVISYDPSQKGASGGHLHYKRITHITENAIYQTLNRKADQLIESGFNGPVGIILCDGGYTPFHDSPTASIYSVKEVILQFMQDTKSVDFVFLLTIESRFSKTGCRLVPSIYCSESFSEENRQLFEILQQVADYFPSPETDARNAINYLRGNHPKEGRSHWGGLSIKEYGGEEMEIKISAKAVLEMLAGKATQKEFFERHQFIPTELMPNNAWNPFLHSILKGQMIEQVSFEKSPTEDDDWIIFKLAGPDPALSPFTMPEKGSKS